MEVNKSYWTERYTKEFSYRSSAHISFSWSYNQYVYKAYLRTLCNMLIKNKRSLSQKKILDIGSGSGYYVEYYKKIGVQSLIGTDITDISVSNLQNKFKDYSFICHDITQDFPAFIREIKFDIISVFDVLYYIIDDQLFEKSIRDISELADSQTLIIITDKFINQSPNKGLVYYKHRNLNHYQKVFKENGLKIIDRQPVNSLLKRPFPFPAFYSFLKWELSKINIDLEKLLGRFLYAIEPLVLYRWQADIQMIFVKKL